MFKHVFLTGPPGVGKTTLVQKACEALTSAGMVIDGFYTEEVRTGGRRVGFDVVTVSGRGGSYPESESSASSSGRHEPRVGQYVVDLPSFENLALPLFKNVGAGVEGGKKAVFVIDEIGKMELFSQAFIRAVRQTLDSSTCSILGTIPIPKGKPLGLVEEVRNRRDVKVFAVTKDNRDMILQDIMSALQECIK